MSDYYKKGFEWAKTHSGPVVDLPFLWVEFDEPDPDDHNEKNTDFYDGAIEYWKQKETADYKLEEFFSALNEVAKRFNAELFISDTYIGGHQIIHHKFDELTNIHHG